MTGTLKNMGDTEYAAGLEGDKTGDGNGETTLKHPSIASAEDAAIAVVVEVVALVSEQVAVEGTRINAEEDGDGIEGVKKWV
jgi:hypothetical protein